MNENEDIRGSADPEAHETTVDGDELSRGMFGINIEQGSTLDIPRFHVSSVNRLPNASDVIFHEPASGSEYAELSHGQCGFDSIDRPLGTQPPTAADSAIIPPQTRSSNEAEHHGVDQPCIPQQEQWPETVGPETHHHPSQTNAETQCLTHDENFLTPYQGNIQIPYVNGSSSHEEHNHSAPNEESTTYEMSHQDDREGHIQHFAATKGTPTQQECLRVDILSLEVVECPLQKDGRHTIICGRLPDNHPYAIAARRLGRYLISKQFAGVQECTSKVERRNNFCKDWKAFHEELFGVMPKLPVIGGGELDIYSLVHEVLLLGGVLNVVKKRAFRVVAQQLELPKSCTSAASVLKNAYEKLLYYYEEKLVHDRMPQDVNRKLDMKQMAMEEKLKERKAAERLARMAASKKRSSGSLDLLLDVGDCTDLLDEDGFLDREDPRLKRILLAVSDRPRVALKYLDLILGSDIEDLLIPELEDASMDDGSFQIVLQDIVQMDELEQVETGADAVLLAFAECLTLVTLGLDTSFERPKDLGLGKAICILTFCSPNMKRGLGLLIGSIIKASKIPSFLQLADKNSTHGLIDGLFYLIYRYLRNESTEDEEYEASEVDVLSAAYCALSAIQVLIDEEQNRAAVITNVGFRHAVGRFLGYEECSRSFLLVMLDIIAKCCSMMADMLSERDMDLFVNSLVQRLEMATGLDPEETLEHEMKKTLEAPPDYEISSKVLPILVTLARKMGIRCRNSGRLIELCVRMLHCQERIADNTNLALVVYTIVERFPSMIGSNRDLVRGVLKLIRDATCVDIASETLIVINRIWPVRELVLESGLFSGWKHCDVDRDAPLTHLMEGLNDGNDQIDKDHDVARMVLLPQDANRKEQAFDGNTADQNGAHCADEGATEPRLAVSDSEEHSDDNESDDTSVTSMQEGPTGAAHFDS